MRKLIVECWLLLLTGCLTAAPRPADYHAAAPPTAAVTGVVFVANGSGDFRTVSSNLSRVVAETGAPLQIETFTWSLGYGRYLADHRDHCNHLAQGRRLAAQVMAYRQTVPGRQIFLIGHSAGCAVVLAAAEALPPDTVDRIVLLAPSVCVDYDLRPALGSARSGIDVFYSNNDRLILGLGMQIVGTAERRCRVAAGQYGFNPVLATPADAALYSRLRQHPWDPAVSWTGHDGGHYGSNRAGYLEAYVLPLFVSN